jgi:hypothetical protein
MLVCCQPLAALTVTCPRLSQTRNIRKGTLFNMINAIFQVLFFAGVSAPFYQTHAYNMGGELYGFFLNLRWFISLLPKHNPNIKLRYIRTVFFGAEPHGRIGSIWWQCKDRITWWDGGSHVLNSYMLYLFIFFYTTLQQNIVFVHDFVPILV